MDFFGAYKGIKSVVKENNYDIVLKLGEHSLAVTDLMAEQGYGADYKYAHDYKGNFVEQEFLPESLKGTQFYHPNIENQTEQRIAERMQLLWKNKYK